MGLLSSRRKRSSLAGAVTSKLSFLRLLGPGSTLVADHLAPVLPDYRSPRSGVTGTADSSQPAEQQTDSAIQPVSLKTLGQKSAETIRIATFNIKVFGKDKSSDTNVMHVHRPDRFAI